MADNITDIKLPDTDSAGQGAELAELVIRRLRAADWATFRTVRLAALRDAPEAFGSTARDAEQLDEAEWRRRVQGRALFLAQVARQHAGLAAGIAGDHPEDAELISMWVAPAWRGQGVGDRLVEAVLAWAAAERFATVHLWVADGNARAERLYVRHGFVSTGREQPMGGARSGRLEFEMRRVVG
jgi:GNAT superfamily N-acetyltransferase